MPKYPRYQEYVIKDGEFVGDFEQMYIDHADPWEQSTREEFTSEKAVALNLIRKVGAKRVMELGCGFGHYTAKIAALGVQALGVDISPTAIAKAKTLHPACQFAAGDILDFDLYRQFRPDVIVMAEITWYVLNSLDEFLQFLHDEMPEAHLIHLLNTYPPGVQQYGKEKFTNLTEIMAYFGLNYSEWGEITYPEMQGCKRTYFIGRVA
jgi:SAM-dependent methyltransferase